MRAVEFTIPVRTVSESNQRGAWQIKAARARSQRMVTRVVAASAVGKVVDPTGLRVTLTRVAPRELDDDNLRGALKAIRDGIAGHIGVDDRKREIVAYEYAQERGAPKTYGVRVRIERREVGA